MVLIDDEDDDDGGNEWILLNMFFLRKMVWDDFREWIFFIWIFWLVENIVVMFVGEWNDVVIVVDRERDWESFGIFSGG